MKIFKISMALFVIFICTAGLCRAEEILKVAELNGKVLVKVAPSIEWVDAVKGQALNVHDTIKTEADGGVLLELPDKSNVTLKANSELSVEKLLWGEASKKIGVNLPGGELRAILNKLGPDSEFTVKTPTAICGARGTILYILSRVTRTRLFVEDGIGDITNTRSGEKKDVHGGTFSDSNEDGSVTDPSEPSEGDKNAMTSGWDTDAVAEPYSEPAEDKGGTPPDEVEPADVIQENHASQI